MTLSEREEKETMAFWKKVLFLFPVLAVLLYHGRLGKAQVAWTPIFVDGNSQVDLWTVSDTGCSCPRESVYSKHRPSVPFRGITTASTASATPTVDTSVTPPAPTPTAPANDCACCVKDGGCPCGPSSPRRCTQCGLESHCVQMCNVTLDSRVLKSRSGKTFGQIKSPSLVGPGSCWYLLLADRNQRIEIQVYRLVSVGHFNGTSCQSGHLELTEGPEAAGRKGSGNKGRRGGVIVGGPPKGGGGKGLQLCGENERFAPPAVIFADRTSATLLFHVGEPTLRSQFFAYFSFTSSDHKTLGFANRGGIKLEQTDCDWMYQEHQCKTKPGKGGGGKGPRGKGKGGGEDSDKGRNGGACVLASPGFPGIYPPNKVCKYLVTTSSSGTRVNLTFTSLLLPYNQCDTHYIAIHKGATLSSPVLTKICGNRKTQIEFYGPNVLIEFSSGPPVPPYDYNGFRARLDFTESHEDPPATEFSITSSTKTAELGVLMDETKNVPRRIPNTVCDYVYYGNATRSGTFDTRGKGLQIPNSIESSNPNAPITCQLVFYGRSEDVVHMSIVAFDLRAPACESFIEVYDGILSRHSKGAQKICSPSARGPDDPQESFTEQKSIISSGNVLTIVFHQGMGANREFIEGAFLFHDEHLDGALQPSTLCDVVYDGARRRGRDAKKEGPFAEPVAGRSQQLLWNVEGPLRCSQKFELVKGQTITLRITSGERMVDNPHCNTRCQTENGGGGIMDEDLGGGCSCMTDVIPLSQMDHLLIIAADGSGSQVSCLCGDFHHVMPIAVKSTTSLLVEHRVSDFSWEEKGFGYKGIFRFDDENACGDRIKTEPSGSIDSRTKMKALPAAVRNYYHESCTWLLYSKVDRQLTIEMYTSENKPCNVWNVTIMQYRQSVVGEDIDRIREDRIGQVLRTFCPKLKKKTLQLPWGQNNVVLRLLSLSNSPAEFSLRWKSQVVQANTRIAASEDSLSRASTRLLPKLSAIAVPFIWSLQMHWKIAFSTT